MFFIRKSMFLSSMDSPYGVSYWCSIGTKSLSPSVFEISGSKYMGVTTLTFWGNVTSLVLWPFDATCSISYRRSIVTDSLYPAVFEILGPKDIGVTTLTFQGHVTSSITWRFDSTYRVSYWCSIQTKSLSPSVFEIFGSKLPVQCKLCDLYPYAKFGYIFEFPTPTLPIHYDTFIGLRWRLRFVYSWVHQY